jgi:hypothetical protein
LIRSRIAGGPGPDHRLDPDASQEAGADPRDPIEVGHRRERPAALTVLDDPRGEPRTDSRETFELGCSRQVEIDPSESGDIDLRQSGHDGGGRGGGDRDQPGLDAVAKRAEEEKDDDEADEPFLAFGGRQDRQHAITEGDSIAPSGPLARIDLMVRSG